MKTLYTKITLCLFFLWIGGMMQESYAQQTQIEVGGVVIDELGEPLPGANITIKGNEEVGTISDIDGKFSLKSLAPNTTLVISFMGYQTQEIVVKKTNYNLQVTLVPNSEALDEVVVVGMGTQRKVSVVGAVTTIEPAAITAPSTSITNMLGGVVPGIIAVGRSGETGKYIS